MAHFYAEVSGARRSTSSKPATKTGTSNSGIQAHVRGWNSGVRVDAGFVDGCDSFVIYATHGSNGGGHDVFLGTVVKVNGSLQFVRAE